MKKIAGILVLCVLTFSLAVLGDVELRPKYGPDAVPISRNSNHQYFVTEKAPDFWALMPYYASQPNDAACSAATLMTVLNGARRQFPLGASDELVTFKSLVEKQTDDKYKYEVGGDTAAAAAHGVVPGVGVARLAEVLKIAAEKLKVWTPSSEVKLVLVDFDHMDKSRKEFHEYLEKNEKSADDFLILNYLQGDLTGDPEGMEGGGHVAVVGGYDKKKHLVLILDPDRQWYEPYWSPEEKVFESVADKKADRKHPGYVYFKIK